MPRASTTLTSTKSTLPTTLAWWSRPSENDEEVGHQVEWLRLILPA